MLECVPEGKIEHTVGKINPAKTCQPIGAMKMRKAIENSQTRYEREAAKAKI